MCPLHTVLPGCVCLPVQP